MTMAERMHDLLAVMLCRESEIVSRREAGEFSPELAIRARSIAGEGQIWARSIRSDP
jgi:hypothetical protein